LILWKTITEENFKNKPVKYANTDLYLLIEERQIKEAIDFMAERLNLVYKKLNPIFIGVLKGSFVFLSDLIRQIKFDIQIDFIELSSYYSSKESSGNVNEIKGLEASIEGRNVLLVEDIVDTGRTLSYLKDHLISRKPATLKICSLTSKPSCREYHIPLDFVGFEIPDKFIVGYGIDFNEKYRNLPEIYYIEDEK